MIGISLITKVTDCKIPPAFEPRKFINTIDNADAIAIGINEPIDKWNKLISCVRKYDRQCCYVSWKINK